MKRISVLIPAMNEVASIEATLACLKKNASLPEAFEIFVIDGGSSDGTQEVVKRAGVTLLEERFSLSGRSEPLNFGATHSTGDILLFLDADSLVPPNFDRWINQTCETPGVVGGAFEFALGGKDLRLRVVEWVNRIRYRIWPEFYGDQGIFVRKDVFEQLGGFPKIRLLESAVFCREVQKIGKMALITKQMETSPRRFLKGGVFRILAHDVKIWAKEKLGLSTENYAEAYWSSNHTKGFSEPTPVR